MSMSMLLKSMPLLLIVSIAARAADVSPSNSWPQWRGPAANGSATSGAYAVTWDDTKNVTWKVKLPGVGCSTPIVWGDHILITSPADGQDALISLDGSGSQRWRTAIGKGRPGKHRNGSSSNSSPVTDGTYIFAYYRSGNLAGLDFKGQILWKTNLQERFGRDTLYWDIGTSPVLTEKHVIVAVMNEGGSYLVAFDKETGRLAWKVARDYDTPVEGDHSYTTPIVVRRRGREKLVVWGAEHVTAHDVTNGKVLWSCGGFNPERKGYWPSVASAVIAGDVLVVPYARGGSMTGLKLDGEGDVSSSHRLWTRDGVGTFVPTPAAHDGKVYVLDDRGEVTCIDARTGKTLWEGSLPRHRAKYYASPVIAGGKLYATREDGVIFVARVTPEFEVLAENSLGERMIASPVPVANRLLLRGERHLFCVEAH